MTKKTEMAEWILDFFRRAKVASGQIVLFRNLQFAQQQLNSKERSLFLSVMNELLEHGYFTFEQEPIQCLRLSEKGYNYIYDESKVLDCCNDQRLTSAQAQYIASWHESFIQYVNSIRNSISILIEIPEISEDDKKGLMNCHFILDGSDVIEIEKALDNGLVNQDLLDKVERVNKDLVRVAIDNLKSEELLKLYLKTLIYIKIEHEKAAEKVRLGKLNIEV